MKVRKKIVGMLECNCYILEEGNNVLIIDPGDDYEELMKLVGKKNILAILITHHHFDHIGAIKRFSQDIPVYDYSSVEEKEYKLDKFNFKVIYTPGHSKDSISFYFSKEHFLFCGDFIFKNSIGRTDLPTGNMEEMILSIKKIKNYPNDIILYPGHGESTVLGEEKKYNLFINNY